MLPEACRPWSDFFPGEFALSTEFPYALAIENRKTVARGASKRTDRSKREPVDPRPTVLLFGQMRELALYRAEVLEARGYQVLTPGTRPEVEAAIRAGGFDIAVLSYTLPSATVKEISELVRQQCPECPLLMISLRAERDPHVQPDEIVPADLGPSALVDAIRRRLKRRLQ
jgi:CheY-like chemotaxis protein